MNGFRMLLARIGRAADDLLFPSQVCCLCCEKALGEDAQDGLCPACIHALEAQQIEQEERTKGDTDPLPEGIDFVRAAYPYDGAAKKLILLLKFSSVRDAAVPLAREMALLDAGETEVIVPVPTTRRRLRQRGFNQAALLARHMADMLGMDYCEALSREDTHAAQATLPASRRERNLVGCMRADERIRARRVLLVDDVYTTGSTAKEAARALLSSGAQSVGIVAAAQAGGGAKNGPEFLRRESKVKTK